jgi:hypothetical protein
VKAESAHPPQEIIHSPLEPALLCDRRLSHAGDPMGKGTHHPPGNDIHDVMLVREERGERDGGGPGPESRPAGRRGVAWRAKAAIQQTESATCSEGTML